MLSTGEVAIERITPTLPASIPSGEWRYFNSFMDVNEYSTAIIGTKEIAADDYTPEPWIKNIITRGHLNQLPSLNNFIEKANRLLPDQGILAGKMISKEARKEAIRKAHNNTFLFFLVYMFDFIWHRMAPKFKYIRPLYKKLNDGKERVFAVAEVLGRMVAGGFEIIDYEQVDSEVYFVARKVKEPSFKVSKPNALIFRMNRITKGGEMRDFYKLRTMHWYAEYLQHFMYRENGLNEGGKFKNDDDFRIPAWGKFFRRYWLDELPMLYNLLKGDLKLVGVRPLSSQYFNLYTKEFRERRKKYKPGLIPPFYVDLPDTLEEIMASEKKYLTQYDKSPVWTDIKYFFKTIYNIVFNHARSN
jgi:lipopolysaccharide/colanic/teichoic acid biosynthesis glycosyltransferase